MIPFDPSPFTFIAVQAALKAGELLRKGFGTSYEITNKEGIQNLVTQYDKESEKCIIDFVLGSFPDHAILAEESGSSDKKGSSVLWTIDPLDGTVNFAHNIPVFSVSIGVSIDKKMVTGVVYQPMSHELFVAEIDKGAYLNGTKLKVSSTSRFEDAIMTTGFPYNVHENPDRCIDRFAQMAKYGIPIRRLGSAALDLAYVSAGRFDAYWELNLQPWDMAAGKLLVEEAGGKVTQYNGSIHDVFTSAPILATNGMLHPRMIEELKKPL